MCAPYLAYICAKTYLCGGTSFHAKHYVYIYIYILIFAEAHHSMPNTIYIYIYILISTEAMQNTRNVAAARWDKRFHKNMLVALFI